MKQSPEGRLTRNDNELSVSTNRGYTLSQWGSLLPVSPVNTSERYVPATNTKNLSLVQPWVILLKNMIYATVHKYIFGHLIQILSV